MDSELLFIPKVVPVFPLPEVVLFPGTIIPLHVFEPRYRDMVRDALGGEQIVALALLKPGFEPLYYTHRAPIHSTVGVAQIVESEQVEDGNYNVLLRGMGRATIVEEVPEHPYRVARIRLVETVDSSDEQRSEQLRAELFDAIRANPALDPVLRSHWMRLADIDLGLGEMSDLIAAGLPAEAELRQRLLSEPNAVDRMGILLNHIQTLAAITRNHLRAMHPEDHNLN